MVNWGKVRVSQFLKEREGRYHPNDETVQSLKRLDKIDFSGNVYLTDKDSKTDMIIIKPGDLVISGINVSKGAIAVYYGEEPITATIHYSSYVFDNNQVDINYFKRFIKSQSFVRALKDQVKGGIKTEIKPKHLLQLEILLPDINRQKEIVSFFNSIENEIDLISKNDNKQRTSIINLRQQVLEEAIEGKLTARWRYEHRELIGRDNHASKLLEKIKVEKERLTKEGKIKKEKPLVAITDDEKPFELPDGWVWCRLGEISNFIDYRGKTPTKTTSGVRLITAKNVKRGSLSLEPEEFISEAEYRQRMTRGFPQNGDIFFTTEAPLGNVCLNILTEKVSVGQRVITIHPLIIDSKLLMYQLLSKRIQSEINNRRSGITAEGIKSSRFRLIPIPVPPLAEQRAIVNEVSELIAMIDELEKQVSERKGQSGMLMQSVMREAFATS